MSVILIKPNQGAQKNITNVTLEGKVRFASVLKPRRKYRSTDLEYSVDIETTAKELAEFKKLGMNKKRKLIQGAESADTGERETFKDDDGHTYMKLTTPAAVLEDGSLRKLTVIGADQQPWPANKLVGNGSICRVQFSLIPVQFEGQNETSTRLKAIQVIKHVPYESKPFVDMDGFVNEEAPPFDVTEVDVDPEMEVI